MISVIIPVFNIAEYLQNSIGSLIQQTYPDLEIIAVDDGSTDSSSDILQRLAETDHRIRIICQEHSGVTKARLTGAAAARGEWIGFMDGDDYAEPDMYERLLGNATKYNADISHCGYQMVFPNKTECFHNTGRLICQDQEAGLMDLLEGSLIEPGLWNKIYRRRLIQSLLCSGKMDCSIRNNEDLLMNYYLFKEARLSVYEDFCPYHYIVRKGSAVTSEINEHKLRDPLCVMKLICQDTMNKPPLHRRAEERMAGILARLATMPSADRTDLIQPYRTKARKELRRMIPTLWKDRCSMRSRLLYVWAGVYPLSYRAVHKVYARIRRTDRKFQI